MKHIGKLAKVLLVVALSVTMVACAKEAPAQAEKSISIEIRNLQGEELALVECKTQAEVLSDVLIEQDLFEYEVTGLGKFITAMNGLEADPASEYWAIYVNGEYGLYGVDNQKIQDGDTYLFELEEF
ncbi:DUF4430 domain-containing protein [Clostridia bacterium]|nr:DUF4430 domain-containing protein [Clostridia bacterium]